MQSVGFVLTAAGYILGHSHKGRQFPHSAHGTFASILFVPILLQLSFGIYLKLHIHEKSLRPYAVRAHGIVGKAYPILGWTQMLMGATTYGGYCRGSHLGQCLAHYIMVRYEQHFCSADHGMLVLTKCAPVIIRSQGSAFIGYGVILAIILLVGETWVRRSGRSQEWWDSCVITVWVRTSILMPCSDGQYFTNVPSGSWCV